MPNKPPIILLLRFRDLTPPIPGYTLTQHNAITEKAGYVWWGWWKKQTELVPLELWRELSQQINDQGPARVLLIDSGQRKVYETKIHQIVCDFSGAAIEAPENAAQTPPYYGMHKYATWFKLEKITEVSEDALKNLAYRQVPHDDLVAFEHSAFANRKIAGINQLLQFGNISYWVATSPSASTQPALDVPVSSRIVPAIAPKDVHRSEKTRILHISDIHVSSGKHAFAVGPGDSHNLTLAQAVYQALGSNNLPGIVIVTGDLTQIGSAKEFDSALECLDNLRGRLGLTRQDFVIIPGNHDMQWTPAQQNDKDYIWDGEVTIASSDARRNYKDFFRKWYGTDPNDWLSIGRRYFVLGGPTVDVLGLNSSELQQLENSFAGLGRVTTAAFQQSADAFGWNSNPRATDLRILAVHHHLLPVNAVETPKDARKGFGLALDAESQLLKATEYKVDLILHGHQHHPFAGFTQRQRILGPPFKDEHGILVLGSGSTGVKDDELGPIKQRCFNLIELERGRIAVTLYATSENRSEFLPQSWLESVGGRPWMRLEKQ